VDAAACSAVGVVRELHPAIASASAPLVRKNRLGDDAVLKQDPTLIVRLASETCRNSARASCPAESTRSRGHGDVAPLSWRRVVGFVMLMSLRRGTHARSEERRVGKEWRSR